MARLQVRPATPFLFRKLRASPTGSTSAYGAGDAIGSVLSFADASRSTYGEGILHSVIITDIGKQTTGMSLILSDFAIPSSDVVDNAAPAVVDSDANAILAIVTVASSDYITLGNNTVAHVSVDIPYYTDASHTLYGFLVATATPTLDTAADLTVTLIVEPA